MVVFATRWRHVDEKVTGTRKKHTRDREMSEKMKRLKLKMEVQEITFNYFARPQPRDLNFYVMMMMAIQKILLSVVSKFVVGVWDGLDACEISRPEILSQSTLPILWNSRQHTRCSSNKRSSYSSSKQAFADLLSIDCRSKATSSSLLMLSE